MLHRGVCLLYPCHTCCLLCECTAVPESYTGPRMEDGVITPEFVSAMVEEFKAQRLIHKKYALQILLQLKPIIAATPSLVSVREYTA